MVGNEDMSVSVYILECADGTYYTGVSDDPARRLAEHNSGKGAKYICKSRRPARLVFDGVYKNRRAAMWAEREIKKLSHEQKENLIMGG